MTHKVLNQLSLLLAAALFWSIGFAPNRTYASPVPRVSFKTVSMRSTLLSEFWGKSISMRARVYTPKACRVPSLPCPVLFHLPGYGGSISNALQYVGEYLSLSARNSRLAMAHVFIDPSFRGGYNYFTDSENNGPWNSALIQEFIPYLENRYHFGGDPHARFLEGHSSGGWAAVWLQVSNPTFFGGVWGIAPDPLDFRHFYTTDITPGSNENFYTYSNGSLRPLTRTSRTSLKDFMQDEDSNPSQGGIISSYEFSWSPEASNHLPERFFDRRTGNLIQSTLAAWQNYDVHSVLQKDEASLRQSLDGKLNLYCGSVDTFFYNEPTGAMCQFLSHDHFNAVCKIISGRAHSSVFYPTSLYPKGLRYLVITRALAKWYAWAKTLS